MRMHERPPGSRASSWAGIRTWTLRLLAAALLGAATALIVSCGSSGKGLIPTGNAGPLQRDFEEVAQAAQAANGSCTATEAAVLKTEKDFTTLPSTIDPGLHTRLQEGISNLRKRALAMCQQPPATATNTTPPTTTSTSTVPTVTQTTTVPSTPTSTTTPTTSGPGDGTPAPGDGGGEAPPEGGGGGGAGGKEAGK
jgi:hypothetical protein